MTRSDKTRGQLTLVDLTMMATGACIGSGIFLTPSSIARALPAPAWMLGVWVAGAIVSVCGALTFAELGAMMPGAGGMYVYLSEAYGDVLGFLFGWAYLVVETTGSIAALAVAFASSVGYFVPLGTLGVRVVAVGALGGLTVINVLGLRAGATTSNVLTTLKLVGIASIVAIGFVLGSRHTSDFGAALPAQAGLGTALGTAMVGVLWSYGGWQYATFPAGEARAPGRDIPIALVVGTSLVGLIYILANVAYLLLLTPAAMARAPQVASAAVGTVLGGATGGAMAVLIAISTLGSANIFTMTGPRMYAAMAERGLFFRGISRKHPRFGTPVLAIVMQSTWAAVLIAFWGTFERLISYVLFTDWIFFGLAGAAVLVLRRTRPLAERPYRVTGYPFTPLVFVAAAVWFVASTVLREPLQAAIGVGFLALGVPVQRIWARRGS